jgi:hypothetical protein
MKSLRIQQYSIPIGVGNGYQTISKKEQATILFAAIFSGSMTGIALVSTLSSDVGATHGLLIDLFNLIRLGLGTISLFDCPSSCAVASKPSNPLVKDMFAVLVVFKIWWFG